MAKIGRAGLGQGRYTTVRITMNRAAITRLTGQIADDSAHRAALATQARVKANITAAGRIRTGRMLDSIRVVKDRTTDTSVTYEVRSRLSYTRYQEDGIGPVVAKRGSVLRFQPKGSAVFIFRPRTRGFEGAHFFRDAHAAIRLGDFL